MNNMYDHYCSILPDSNQNHTKNIKISALISLETNWLLLTNFQVPQCHFCKKFWQTKVGSKSTYKMEIQDCKAFLVKSCKQIRLHLRSGSVVECLTRYRGAKCLSLICVTVLCPWARHINSSLVLVQPRKTCPYITERLLIGRKVSNQTKIKYIWYSTVRAKLRYLFFGTSKISLDK